MRPTCNRPTQLGIKLPLQRELIIELILAVSTQQSYQSLSDWFGERRLMDDSLSIIEEEMEQLSVTTGEILPSLDMSSPPSVRNGDEQ